MKKNIFRAGIFASILALTSCGMPGSTTTAPVTTNTAAQAGSILGNVLTQLLMNNKTTAENIVGTWTYASPKVVFESESILAQLGSTVASSKIESSIDSQLQKVGFKAGVTKLTLNQDKTCTLVLGGKTAHGTYAFDPNTKIMTVTGALGVGTMTCTATLSGNNLLLLFDADKLLAVATNLSAKTQKTSTLSSLLSNYSGMKMGWTMTK